MAYCLSKLSLSRALKTNTRQTTHDRGGQSAFYFYHTKADIEQVFEQLHEISVAHRRASVLASEEELTPADARKNVEKIGATMLLLMSSIN